MRDKCRRNSSASNGYLFRDFVGMLKRKIAPHVPSDEWERCGVKVMLRCQCWRVFIEQSGVIVPLAGSPCGVTCIDSANLTIIITDVCFSFVLFLLCVLPDLTVLTFVVLLLLAVLPGFLFVFISALNRLSSFTSSSLLLSSLYKLY